MPVLAAAVRQGGCTSPQQILTGLAAPGSVPTVVGEISFIDREGQYPAAVQVIEDGAFVLLRR